MKFDELERMNRMERRKFLRALGFALASPLIPAHIRFACNEIVLGTNQAYAGAAGSPTYFIEINLRDQFDLNHVFVPPGLATRSITRGGAGGVPLYDSQGSLHNGGNGFYIANEGRELIPHLDSIAVVELCELPIGNTHAHEAGNATRSPGRTYNAGSGRSEMNTFEQYREQGNEYLYSSTPTPAILHNYYQLQLSPNIRRGVIYKGVSRPEHTVYHHAANLSNAQMDRYQNTSSLLSAFSGAFYTKGPPIVSTSPNPPVVTSTPTALTANRNLISQLMSLVDSKFAKKMYLAENGVSSHQNQFTNLANTLEEPPVVTITDGGVTTTITDGIDTPFKLDLTPAEVAYWSSGSSSYGTNDSVKANIWEQAAYAFKLVKNDLARSVALEFCNNDNHSERDEAQMRAYGAQIGYPLARLITQLKAAGLYNNTVIAVYTTDGSREPYAQSTGASGKNSVILAGGGIRGGYYGDIQMNGNNFTYFPPDANGNPGNGTGGNGGRVSGASIWKTAMRAAGIPSSLYNSFPDVQGAPELNYMIR